MNLEEIKKAWKVDSVLDEIMLDQSSIRIPQLHYKYVTYHTEFSILLKKKQQEYKKLCHDKFLYYSGKADPQVYVTAPFGHKVLKSDVKNWIDVDADVQKMELEVEYYHTVIYLLEEIIKQVNQMSFNVKNAVQWRVFTGGV